MQKHFGDDHDLLKEVALVFLEACPGWQADIRAAIAANDAPALRRAAHTLKGAVGHFGAKPSYDAAQELETLGHTNQLASAPSASAALDLALHRLLPALQSLCKS